MIAGAVIDAVAAALAPASSSSDMLVELGMIHGAGAFERTTSLHHMLRGADLLVAMTLYAVEDALDDGNETLSFRDGLRLSRRIQQIFAVFTLALAKGYTHAAADGLRDRYRMLRHDLRNPLGTITHVLALMSDETVPAEARANPRFRAMAERNARSLEALIGSRLSDAAARLPEAMARGISLRTVACSVRRDLRADTMAHGASIAVGPDVHAVRLDSGGLELLLHALLRAALQEAAPGDELGVDFGGESGDRAPVFLDCDPPRHPIADPQAMERLAGLASRIGAELAFGQRVTLTVPLRRDLEARADAPQGSDRRDVPPQATNLVTAPESAAVQTSDDLGRSREHTDR
ncbi:MAG: hypothetical protein H0W68_00170 [Gemmatimonadaceae bacterium]|nr:hypothetical protein [Gemmatimonadaceae bacterium]